jgi:hypothetical protein
MKFFRRTQQAVEIDRRAVNRQRVDCTGCLVMPTGRREGRMIDLSELGARFETGDPPPVGCSAILEWPCHEAYAWVAWVNDGKCGVEFDRPIPKSVVDQTVALSGTGTTRSRVDRGRIPLGRRRSRI